MNVKWVMSGGIALLFLCSMWNLCVSVNQQLIVLLFSFFLLCIPLWMPNCLLEVDNQ